MVSSVVTRRLGQLEEAVGDDSGSCPRCEDTIIVRGFASGTEEDLSVTKNGYRLSPEAGRLFEMEERPNGICPDCGRKRRDIRVGWASEETRNRLNNKR